MKYTKGTPTLLGKIEQASECGQDLYTVKSSVYHRFTESEIDAIVIKPKRNIDKMMELWDMGLHDDAVEILRTCLRFTSYEDIVELRKPYIEPRKYPVLTPEELKAVKWLVDGGYTSVQNYKNDNIEVSYGTGEWFGTECIPIVKRLQNSTWITETPINLKELLEAQEDV